MATNQTKPGLFKFAVFKRWAVAPSGMKLVEDVRRAPDDVLSIHEPIVEVRTAPHGPIDVSHGRVSFFK